jgi:hypothetical protein
LNSPINTISYHLWSFRCKFALKMARISGLCRVLFKFTLLWSSSVAQLQAFQAEFTCVPKKEASGVWTVLSASATCAKRPQAFKKKESRARTECYMSQDNTLALAGLDSLSVPKYSVRVQLFIFFACCNVKFNV